MVAERKMSKLPPCMTGVLSYSFLRKKKAFSWQPVQTNCCLVFYDFVCFYLLPLLESEAEREEKRKGYAAKGHSLELESSPLPHFMYTRT